MYQCLSPSLNLLFRYPIRRRSNIFVASVFIEVVQGLFKLLILIDLIADQLASVDKSQLMSVGITNCECSIGCLEMNIRGFIYY